jgi:hypothetical protein
MRPLFPLLAAALLLSACTTVSPEARIRTRLVEVGLDRDVAACMAERLVDKLSMNQLRKLSSLSKLGNADLRTMTIEEFFHKTRALGDPKILRVVTKAGIGCAIAA